MAWYSNWYSRYWSYWNDARKGRDDEDEEEERSDDDDDDEEDDRGTPKDDGDHAKGDDDDDDDRDHCDDDDDDDNDGDDDDDDDKDDDDDDGDPDPDPNTDPEITSPTDTSNINVSLDTVGEFTELSAFDADGDSLVFTLSGEEVGGVSDADFFELTVVNDTVVALGTANDDVLDINGSADGDSVYELTLEVDDGNGGTDSVDFTVTLVSGA